MGPVCSGRSPSPPVPFLRVESSVILPSGLHQPDAAVVVSRPVSNLPDARSIVPHSSILKQDAASPMVKQESLDHPDYSCFLIDNIK